MCVHWAFWSTTKRDVEGLQSDFSGLGPYRLKWISTKCEFYNQVTAHLWKETDLIWHTSSKCHRFFPFTSQREIEYCKGRINQWDELMSHSQTDALCIKHIFCCALFYCTGQLFWWAVDVLVNIVIIILLLFYFILFLFLLLLLLLLFLFFFLLLLFVVLQSQVCFECLCLLFWKHRLSWTWRNRSYTKERNIHTLSSRRIVYLQFSFKSKHGTKFQPCWPSQLPGVFVKCAIFLHQWFKI